MHAWYLFAGREAVDLQRRAGRDILRVRKRRPFQGLQGHHLLRSGERCAMGGGGQAGRVSRCGREEGVERGWYVGQEYLLSGGGQAIVGENKGKPSRGSPPDKAGNLFQRFDALIVDRHYCEKN